MHGDYFHKYPHFGDEYWLGSILIMYRDRFHNYSERCNGDTVIGFLGLFGIGRGFDTRRRHADWRIGIPELYVVEGDNNSHYSYQSWRIFISGMYKTHSYDNSVICYRDRCVCISEL